MTQRQIHLMSSIACLTILTGLAWSQSVPRFEVDPSWPKQLPEGWVMGGLGGVCVDAHDHVFILNRQDVIEGDLNAGKLAPPVIEFDQAGNVVNSWGDNKFLDPRLHSCAFDKATNIWLDSSPSGMLLQYSHDGSKLLRQIGQKGVLDSSDGTEKGKPLNSNAAKFFLPSSIFIDATDGNVWVADGEGSNGNRRIMVLDKDGNFIRQWQPEGTLSTHCMAISNDGLVYVTDREGGHIQVYDKMGKLLKSIPVPWTPYTPPADGKPKANGGASVAFAFSSDAKQKYMYVINQNNARIEILERESGKNVGHFGRAGNFPGQLAQPHGIAVDSKGNVYVAENRGKRIQRFKVVR